MGLTLQSEPYTPGRGKKQTHSNSLPPRRSLVVQETNKRKNLINTTDLDEEQVSGGLDLRAEDRHEWGGLGK